jgi:hypothetical protein
MRKRVLLCALVAVGSSCSNDLTSTSGESAHGVVITADITSHASSGDSIVVHISNAGVGSAFLPRCGSGPLLLTQQFTNGAWTGGVQNFLCIAPPVPGPIELAAGASIDIVRVMDVNGRYRFIVAVAEDASLTTAVTAASNSFDVP